VTELKEKFSKARIKKKLGTRAVACCLRVAGGGPIFLIRPARWI